MMKLILENWKRYLLKEQEPLALAVLGAPAGGKSYTMDKISSVVSDPRITKTIASGVVLTVDKLREEFQSKSPIDQLTGFIHAFYFMKEKSKEDPENYAKWFTDIAKLWSEKFAKLMPELKVSVTNEDVLFGGAPAIKSVEKLKNIDAAKVIQSLDTYNDYKRVVRYFQSFKQEDAIVKKLNVSYDEAGDEPQKIVNNLKILHKKGYVTDVFLIHAKNVASNLIQNYYRVTTGGDGGRDSSGAIVQAYNDIEKNKKMYSSNSEASLTVPSEKIADTSKAVNAANTQDDPKLGDKPIDVFVQVEPMNPAKAFATFSSKLDKEQLQVFKAYLRYAAIGLNGVPDLAKQTLLSLSKDLSNQQAFTIFVAAAKTGKYKFANGGLSEEFLKKAQVALGSGATPQKK